MKRILLLLIIPFLLCGCTHDMNKQEIDDIDLVLLLGIDYTDNSGYTVTALYNSGQSAGAGGEGESDSSGQGTETKIQGRGNSPYEALENLKQKNKKVISLAHTGYFLVGAGAAGNGIDQCLDFLSRDETIKMESLVFITKDMDAADFIDEGLQEKQVIHENIEAIDKKQQEMITRNDNTLVNLVNGMKQTTSSLLIPYLQAKDKNFVIAGYAVFDKLKLKDYLDYDTSSGVNFIKNIIRSYPIYLNNQASLALSYSKTKLKSDIKDGIIHIKIQVDFETMIKEVITKDNLFTPDGLEKLRTQQSIYVKNIVRKAANYSLVSGLDILQVARLVENQHVKEWKTYEKNWVEYIPNIQYDFTIHSKVTKSFIQGNER